MAKVRDSFAAHMLADRMLRETYHHLAVEVWEDGERLFTLSGTSNQDPEHTFSALSPAT